MNIQLNQRAYTLVDADAEHTAIQLHPKAASLLGGRLVQVESAYDLRRHAKKNRTRQAWVEVPWWLALALWWMGFTKG